MKKIIVYMAMLCLCCCVETIEPETTATETSIKDNNNIYFNNLSDYEVNVYFNTTPYSKDKSIVATVGKRSNKSIYLRPSFSNVSDVFYFEYMIPIGNMSFPVYNPNNGFKDIFIESDKINRVNIEKLTESKTESAFFLIENKSNAAIQLRKGMFYRKPVGSNELNIANAKSAVYELNNGIDSDFTFSGIDTVKIVVNVTDYALPITSVEKGMIYTMVVTADNVSLKSITPFNIDLQNQIWNKEIDANTYNVQCVRQDKAKEGVVVISTGVNQPNVIQCDLVDKYGETITNKTDKKTAGLGDAKSITVYDCLHESDGSVVMLLQKELTDDIETHLFGYDFSGTLKFDYKFDPNYYWVFRKNMQNSICRIDTGEYAVVGGMVDEDYAMSSFIMKIDTTGSEIAVTPVYSDVTTDAYNGVQTMFTSVYYDGNDFYACGYENCDFQYGSNIHKGVIYKISNDLQNWEKVYTKDKTLLFGIVGKDNHYWACGEYADSGNILKGCLVCDSTNDMQIFTADLGYHWFNQIAISGDKFLLCGPTSQNKDGSGEAYSVVTAVDKGGKIVWSNTFKKYNNALSCIPNGIGSYIVQLNSSDDNNTVIVSADLLGGNTGESK